MLHASPGDIEALHVYAYRMDTVCNAGLAGALGQPLDEGRMDIDGRNLRIRERLRQGEGRAAAPRAQVEHPSNGIAARNRIQRT